MTNKDLPDGNDQDTHEENARDELRDLYENWFNGNLSATALALGRTENEIDDSLAGEPVDEDLLMKIRGIKDERQSQARSS